MSKYSYAKIYSDLTAPSDLTLAIRKEAYGTDIGQHSWVTSNELDKFVGQLSLSTNTKVLDIGSGAGGPTMYIAKLTGCHIIGIDVNQNGIDVGNKLSNNKGLADKVSFKHVDAGQGLPFPDGQFNAIISFDAIIHIKDRNLLFSEIVRVLLPGGVLIFTDAGVVTGIVSSEEFALRSINGFTLFHPSGYNERLLQEQGFELIKVEDTTRSVLDVAGGRLRARNKFKSDLVTTESTECFEQEQSYLQTLVKLSEEKRLSRFAYFAKKK
jgi:SAM-dependent methyltransferase